MTYDFTKLKNEIKETEEWVKKEYQSIRTGMASPQLLDGIQVESYGQRMPLNQVCLLYTSPSPRDGLLSRMPSSA